MKEYTYIKKNKIEPPSYVGGFLFENFFVYLNYDRRYKSYSSQK